MTLCHPSCHRCPIAQRDCFASPCSLHCCHCPLPLGRCWEYHTLSGRRWEYDALSTRWEYHNLSAACWEYVAFSVRARSRWCWESVIIMPSAHTEITLSAGGAESMMLSAWGHAHALTLGARLCVGGTERVSYSQRAALRVWCSQHAMRVTYFQHSLLRVWSSQREGTLGHWLSGHARAGAALRVSNLSSPLSRSLSTPSSQQRTHHCCWRCCRPCCTHCRCCCCPQQGACCCHHAPLMSLHGHAAYPIPPPPRPLVFSWLLCVKYRTSAI